MEGKLTLDFQTREGGEWGTETDREKERESVVDLLVATSNDVLPGLLRQATSVCVKELEREKVQERQTGIERQAERRT